MTDDEVCHAVHAKRLAEGYSLRALGKVLGVSFSTLARIERGEGAPSLLARRRMEAWLIGENPLDIHPPTSPMTFLDYRVLIARIERQDQRIDELAGKIQTMLPLLEHMETILQEMAAHEE